MKKKIFVFAVILATITVFEGCKQDPQGIDTLKPICFDNQIQPIFAEKCNMSGCHGASSEEGYDFRSYSGIFRGITPYEPNNSEVYKVITAKWGQIMPPKGNDQLSEEQRSLIYVWIKQGAKNTKCN